MVAPDANGNAEGTLYLDDGDSFDHQRGHRRLRKFVYRTGPGAVAVFKSEAVSPDKQFAPPNTVERVVIMGVARSPVAVEAQDGKEATASRVSFTYDAATHTVTLRKPDVKVAYDWTITLSF